MKGMLCLWRNECSKIFRQTANKVIIVIALVLSLLTPLLYVGLNSTFDFMTGVDNEEYWQNQADISKDAGNWYDYSFNEARLEATKFFRDNSISVESWKYQSFFDPYCLLLERRLCERFYLEGKISKEDFADRFFWDFDVTDDASFEEKTTESGEIDPSWLDSFDVEADLAETTEQIAQLEKMMKLLTLGTYAAERLTELRSELKADKNELSEKTALLEKGKGSQYDVDVAALTVEGTEYMISFFESIKNARLEGDDGDWMVTTAEIIGESARGSLATVPVSEEEFKSGTVYAVVSGVSDYEQYRRMTLRTQTDARRALMTVDYSLSHGIRLPETDADSTKTLIRHSLATSASIVILALVVITANNVAAEYTSGTIRLLLIRPRSRTKIILSKFLAILASGIALSAAAFLAVNATSVAIEGFGDMFVTDLIFRGGVVEVNSIVYSLLKMLLPLLSGTLLVALAFLMSVLTRRAAIAIVVPLALNMFKSLAQYAAASYVTSLPILRYTAFPYLDLGPFLSSPTVNYFTDYRSGMLNRLIDTAQSAVYADLSAVTGVIVIVIHLAVIFGVSFVIFRRQQIKS